MIQGIVETIRKSFQTRDYKPFVDLFTENGAYETPFAVENKRIEGLPAIGKHFAKKIESPINKALKI
ncbi:hypothetical protein FO440_05960 [Mucilaginibacter corticis]|uniref:Nuclear transport factor 2 family protein n=1 Tax=Mucilaginibacter corticis TaxID=2597670 RepID=A0A556MV41_9SPHI|nr:hypothetical protein [Mucilaginibacter corticis]TSJ43733.1 hypothetical protein FO440_05960 [Mucilaginibacter corticis]